MGSHIQFTKELRQTEIRRRVNALPMDVIKAQYEAGESSTVLAERYEVTASTIIKKLRSVGVVIRSQGQVYTWTPELLAKATELRDKGMSGHEVARTLNVPADSLYKKLTFGNRLALPEAVITQLFREGCPVREIARRYNTSPSTIQRRLYRWGVMIKKEPPLSTPLDPKKVESLHGLLKQLKKFRQTERGWQQRSVVDPQIIALEYVLAQAKPKA
ncbi:hypothetical protein P6F34_gp10 [Pseudomonas phage MiCath]|uniref:Transposase IS30-like HTH domain-containing protein n=1 Tax=Pseudomonas phage MiCath TaxID=3003729 RepID=A0AAF0AGU0_9CAUD|nr:hypothetical protein P6F34_gp10 [Pseudomonas phage MiCath]WAX22364.1 hypothetical protein [Pseudomonas phage MiCath]